MQDRVQHEHSRDSQPEIFLKLGAIASPQGARCANQGRTSRKNACDRAVDVNRENTQHLALPDAPIGTSGWSLHFFQPCEMNVSCGGSSMSA